MKLIDEVFEKNISVLEKGTKLYRARLTELTDMNIQDDILTGFDEKGSMSPDAMLATAQRASPEKISYLYVAQDEYTALSETRPGLLSFISLAETETIEDLNIFDLWIDIATIDTVTDFTQFVMNFSAVIAEKNKGIDYLPMQYIAEYIKNKGADGIRYASFQSQGGKNFVIFKKEKVRFLQSKIMYNQNVTYTFLDITRPENKPLANESARRALHKNFPKIIKSAVIALQSRKLKNNGG